MKHLRRRLKWKKKPLSLKTSYWLNRLVERISNRIVMQGPFAGMKYIPGIPGDSYTPQLLGTYELELHEVLSDLVKYRADAVVNVGAGEGFYAIGFARLVPSPVVAFEGSEQMRERLAAMADANGVRERIDIRSACQPLELEQVLAGHTRPLIIMDIDGGEDQVLDPVKVPALRQSAILVETHDVFVPGITDELARRFSCSHRTCRIPTRGRSLSDLPKRISPAHRLLLRRAMREHRGSQQAWLIMLPTP